MRLGLSMLSVLTLLGAVLGGSCARVIGPGARTDAGSKLADLRPDQPGGQPSDASADVAPPGADAGPPRADAVLPADSHDSTAGDLGAGHMLEANSLSAAWQKIVVPCLDDTGTVAGSPIPLLDGPTVTFVDGQTTLAGAPPETVAWAAGASTVTVIWNPNACGTEDPVVCTAPSGDWTSAAFLIRGAELVGPERARLPAGITAADLNILDVIPGGAFECEFALPDDSELALYPNLETTISEATRALLALVVDA